MEYTLHWVEQVTKIYTFESLEELREFCEENDITDEDDLVNEAICGGLGDDLDAHDWEDVEIYDEYCQYYDLDELLDPEFSEDAEEDEA